MKISRTRPAGDSALLGGQDDPRNVFCQVESEKATTATELFRNKELFAALREVAIPALFSRSRCTSFMVWSAGCSSGEEVYSLAMTARDAIDKYTKTCSLTVFGTDIHDQKLHVARRGVYLLPESKPAAINNATLLSRFTQRKGAKVRIKPELAKYTKFGVFDLRKAPRKHTFHFIVCNHVLQYYKADVQQQIVRNLCSVVRPGGYLYLEGTTQDLLEKTALVAVPGARNLYQP